MTMRSALSPALGTLLLVFPLAPLKGHAILLSAAPTFNETVQGTTVQVQLRFNERIDAKRSTLMLVLPGGAARLLPPKQPSPDTLTSDVPRLMPGDYILRWQVLAEDGHITRGQIPFRAR